MPAVTNYFLTGKIALFSLTRTDGTVGTGDLPVTTATIATKLDTPDASSFATGGYTGLVPGIMSAEITVEILYDKLALPPIFAGMKADVELSPTGGRAGFLASSPTSTEATLGTNEYGPYAGDPLTFIFENCTVTSVTYDVPVKDVQKVKLTLIPSASATVNFGANTF
tara:strand:- start:170 stop:673 length:504 start_codon:yes stop_codon:yes gene_type:complete